MKRMLFSVVLLIAAGTVALLGRPTNAETLTPIPLTDELQMKLSGSQWDGNWYDTANGVGGDAGLYLVIGYGHADARFSIQSEAAGYHEYRALGRVNGNTMELEYKGNATISLSLYREGAKFVLKGEYEVTGGEYYGEMGTYYFVKK